MKNIFKLIIAIVLLNATYCYAGINSFIITVKSDNAGGSLNTQFTIPTFGAGYNYNVDCNNDGTFEGTALTGDYTCDFIPFGGAGTYQVRMRGNQAGFEGFPRIYFNNTGDRLKVLNIDQWGINPWKSMRAAFQGTSNMTVTAMDVPNLSQVGDIRLMFSAASMANPDTSMWDTSNITNMAAMFQNATSATPNVSNWDVSMVSNMGFLFAGATNANPNLSQWDFNNATDMTTMLGGSAISTTNYDNMLVNINKTTGLTNIVLNNVPTKRCSTQAQQAHDALILAGWTINDLGICDASDPINDFVIIVKTDNVGLTGSEMFNINVNTSVNYTLNYNVDCNDDGTDEITATTDDYICDYSATGLNTGAGEYTIRIKDNSIDRRGFIAFSHLGGDGNSDAKKIISLEQWGTSKWVSTSAMFQGAENMLINATDIPDFSEVTTMQSMFKGCSLAKPNTKYWDTHNVLHMGSMFHTASVANPDTSLWDTSKVTNMGSMFTSAFLANPDTSGWDTAQVTSMATMFAYAAVANPDTSGWDTANVEFILHMFIGAQSANPDTSNWNTAKITSMRQMFQGAISATPNTSSWDISMVTNMEGMFAGVILPTAVYDDILISFNNSNPNFGLTFSGGNSKYCAVAAHDNLMNAATGHGWIITDGGLCDDFIFKNSFEDVIVFKAAQKQFIYDFAEVSLNLDPNPLLIARGVDKQNNTVIKIYLRKNVGQLQIRKDTLEINSNRQSQWVIGKWQNADNNKLTQIFWK